MAAGHLPTSSHNFAWRGVINHDRTTKLTLQTKYDHTMPAGYPKVAYPLEISFWIRNLFTHGQTLPGRFAIDSEAIDRRVDVVYHYVIIGSRESRDHHYDARLIHRIMKSLLPQNNTFFIATASVVKDAADNPDCQGLREQWYYLWFYVRRTMPPTERYSNALISWWRHQMETLSALLTFCEGNSSSTGEFFPQRPVTRSLDVFFYLRQNKRLSKQWWGWWFETPSRPLWRHFNDNKTPITQPWYRWRNILSSQTHAHSHHMETYIPDKKWGSFAKRPDAKGYFSDKDGIQVFDLFWWSPAGWRVEFKCNSTLIDHPSGICLRD